MLIENKNQPTASRYGLTRRAACLGIGTAALSAATGTARASDWPTRAVTVVVPYSPGGNTDMMARLASQYIADKLGQPFVVENRAGGGGSVGAIAVARAQPDGYTLLFGASTQIVNIPMLQRVSYDPQKDLVPISIFGAGPYLLGIKASLPCDTMQEFINYVKANPGKLNYATAEIGGNVHLNTALFVARAGLDMVAVPYKSGAPAMAGLAAGEVEMYFGNASELMQHIESKYIKILAVSTLQKLKQLPDVPTVAETYPGFEHLVVERLFRAHWNPNADPRPPDKGNHRRGHGADNRDRLNRLAVLPSGTTQDEFRKMIEESRVANRVAMKAAGLAIIE